MMKTFQVYGTVLALFNGCWSWHSPKSLELLVKQFLSKVHLELMVDVPPTLAQNPLL